MYPNTAIEGDVLPKADSTEIIATMVNDEDRLNFLPTVFRQYFMKVEMLTYSRMDILSPDYNGGYWEFYNLSNGGGYLAPRSDTGYRIMVLGNGFDAVVTADSAGIIATLFTLSELVCSTQSEQLYDRYEQLQDFIYTHPESDLICSAID